MIEKVVIVFCICSLVNVILSTLKTLIMVNAGRGSAIIINAICYGFYTLVVKQLGAVDYVTAVVVTILANIVGVWISYKIMDLFKKDKLWRITVTLKSKKALDECKANLEKYNIGFTPIEKTNSIDIYSYNQKESLIIKNILANYDYKYFIQEMAKSL
jgi:membrane protein DedA with SNARE-associated domain